MTRRNQKHPDGGDGGREAPPRRHRTTSVGAALLALVLALAACGPSGTGTLQDGDAALGLGEPGVEAGGGSTTTIQTVERRSYRPGDCVWWDQDDSLAESSATKVVACEKRHILEVTGRIEVTDRTGGYPDEAYWEGLFETGQCLALAEGYLRAKLDPHGNIQGSGLQPTAESWRGGDREVWCGLALVPLDARQAARPDTAEWTGRVSAPEQYRVYPVGSCVGEAGTGDDRAWGVVPCDKPHTMEVSGHVDLTNRLKRLPRDDGWEPVVADDCDRLGRAYAGAALRGAVQPGWQPIEAASWEAGRRTLLCVVAEYRNEEAVSITRRIRP